MEKNEQLDAIRKHVQSIFSADVTGHDAAHMMRVANLAKEIGHCEEADVFITEAAALLHDIGDKKLFSDPDKAIKETEHFLSGIGISNNTIKNLKHIIMDVSFSKGSIPTSLEGKIVQDADRIDAIGAIGIARTFAYGGANGQPIHHQQSDTTSIQHFYDKLLKLKDTLHTPKAKEMATERHQFLLTFLEQFWHEWQT
ncbi:MAG TPA: HD domain-containing protein [Bacillota bacterium]|nr:HD domain-containing protein [Bacillota bacterium]